MHVFDVRYHSVEERVNCETSCIVCDYSKINTMLKVISQHTHTRTHTHTHTPYTQITLMLALLSSVFIKDKCKRIRPVGSAQNYCVYPVDIVFCGVIILLLVPQIIVVGTHTHILYTHTHTHTHGTIALSIFLGLLVSSR